MTLKYRVLLLTAAALCISAPAAAVTYDYTFGGLLGSVPVRAEAVYAAGVWTYTYTADISQLSRNVTGFSVGNLSRAAFFNAANDRNFTNPSFAGTDSIMWTAGSVAPSAGPITFTFQSAYGPAEVNATIWGGAFPSTGRTLGLVPEPSGLVALGACLGSLPVIVMRRSKNRKA